MSQFEKEYRQFFTSPAGEYYLQFLEDQIESEHEKAENAPESSRDHVQRAKGIRVALEHINIITIERKSKDT